MSLTKLKDEAEILGINISNKRITKEWLIQRIEAEKETLRLWNIKEKQEEILITDNYDFLADHPIHTTEPIRYPRGNLIDIDVGIAELIRQLWYTYNFKTTNSCEDNYVWSPKKRKNIHFVWISFAEFESMAEFVEEFIIDSIDRYYLVLEDWEFNINVENTNIKFDKTQDTNIDLKPLSLQFNISVRFPVEQLKLVKILFGVKNTEDE